MTLHSALPVGERTLAPDLPGPEPVAYDPWADALRVAALVALDPEGLGGVVVRAHAGPVRDIWMQRLRALIAPGAVWRKVPPTIADERLLGGLDMAATLRAGKPMVDRGVLAGVDGGYLVLPMAERISGLTLSRLTGVLDTHEVVVERDGITDRCGSRFGVIAEDEGVAADETVAAALVDRLAFRIDLEALSIRDAAAVSPVEAATIRAARSRLASVTRTDDDLATVCALAEAFGVSSVRATLFALRAASALAALDGRTSVIQPDIETATRLVLIPRATRMPALPPEDSADQPPEPPPPEPPSNENPPDADDTRREPEGPAEDVVLAALAAVLPAGLLAQLKAGLAIRRTAPPASGGMGAEQKALRRGRPIGVKRGKLDGRERLHVVETLRAAAPWQRLRREAALPGSPPPGARAPRIQVRAEDIRTRRFRQTAETVMIFAVDASGSTAMNRLGEAKGAVELLLADCYSRRDQVALIAFRGRGAELLLPPTRSLVRAKRSLAGVPGGGGTPLAAGLEAALAVATDISRKGQTPSLILLTDGSANVGHDPTGGRKGAREDALRAARQIRAAGLTALVVDTAPRPQGKAEEIATAMGALFVALPNADAGRLRDAVKAAPLRREPGA
jgi:magnesium chelatase subunit D